MDAIKQYLIPYSISNGLFLLCLVASIKKPIWARLFLALVFLMASYINLKTAIRTPQVYLEYARLAWLPIYRDFILGYFSRHIKALVIGIAVAEFVIFIGMLLSKGFLKMACWSGIIFGLAIAPLGIGSAFPATITMAFAFWKLYRKSVFDYAWNWKQYKKAGPQNRGEFETSSMKNITL